MGRLDHAPCVFNVSDSKLAFLLSRKHMTVLTGQAHTWTLPLVTAQQKCLEDIPFLPVPHESSDMRTSRANTADTSTHSWWSHTRLDIPVGYHPTAAGPLHC